MHTLLEKSLAKAFHWNKEQTQKEVCAYMCVCARACVHPNLTLTLTLSRSEESGKDFFKKMKMR